MNTFIPSSIRACSAILILSLLLTSGALAQLGTSTAATQAATANQLPLSGRSAQSGSVTATQSPVPGTTTSVDTLNPSVQGQGAFSGSLTGPAFSGKLSLQEALQRGLPYNLGSVGLSLADRQAQGQSRVDRSALLPNFNGSLAETVEQLNLRASGGRVTSPIPGFGPPPIVAPFNFFHLPARR